MCSSNNLWGENYWWIIIVVIILIWVCYCDAGMGGCGENNCGENNCGCCGGCC